MINIFTQVVDHSSTPDITAVNRSYVLLVNELKQIYERQPELKKIGRSICWSVLDNLEQIHETAIEYTMFANDYGQEHNSSVSSLCILADKEKPDLTPSLEKMLIEADKNIAQFKSKLDKMYATLSFESFSVPVVTVGEEKYRFPSTMREGIALTVITYCLQKHPNEQLDLETLKSELKEASIPAHGLNNFREPIRKTVLATKHHSAPLLEYIPRQYW